MARFEMNLMMAIQGEDDVHVIEHDIMCFCENPKNREEVTEKAHKIISEMMQSEEGEVLFGLAEVEMEDSMINITFRNKNYAEEEMNRLMDIILDIDTETMH